MTNKSPPRRGCLIALGAVFAIPLVLLLAGLVFIGMHQVIDANCARADPVRVRLRDTVYAIPAALQPIFAAAPEDHRIRTPIRSPGGYEYCPGSKAPVRQRQIILRAYAKRPIPHSPPTQAGDLKTVRLITIDATGAPRLEPDAERDQIRGPALFGQPTVSYRFKGYYGPETTCRVLGHTPDGSSVTVQIYPCPEGADLTPAVQGVDALVTGLRVGSTEEGRR